MEAIDHLVGALFGMILMYRWFNKYPFNWIDVTLFMWAIVLFFV